MSGADKVRRFFALDKFATLRRTIKQHGGILGSISQIYRTDWGLKEGKLVGVDEFGNKYYENNNFFLGRNRWVDFSKKVWLNYDATMVPPEWHRWLHNTTDHPPSTHPPVRRTWMMKHEMNNSGEIDKIYVPYSTTRTKIEGWVPGRKA